MSTNHFPSAAAYVRSDLPVATLLPLMANYSIPAQFNRWMLIQGVRNVNGQDGAWDRAGKSRRFTMDDGSTVDEYLLAYDPTRGWRNRLSGFTNEVGKVLDHIEDEWNFIEDGDGTRVSWQWRFRARPDVKGAWKIRFLIIPLHKIYLQRILTTTLAKLERSAQLA